MKKHAIFSTALMLTLLVGTAPSYAMKVGVLGGLNFASFKYDPEQTGDFSSRNTLFYGAVLDMELLPILAITPEVLLVKKGSKFKSGTTTVTTKLDYVEIPILARIQLPLPMLTVFGTAGPYIAFRTSAETETETEGSTASTVTDVKDSFEGSDMGLQVGAGVALDIAPAIDFEVSARYNVGSKEIDKADAVVIKNADFRFLAGLKFGF